MGFLSDSSKGPSIYTEITEEPKLVRPLASKPVTLWCHKICSVVRTSPDGKTEVIRPFSHEACTSTGRNGVGCYLCNTPDPLWHLLTEEEKYTKQGKRVDFGKTPLHMLPVHEHATNSETIIKSGNMLFKPMDEWYDTQQGSNQDLRRCDWAISKAGKQKRTQYKTSRMDVSAFAISPEMEETAKNLMAQAMQDRRPTAPDILAKIIRGQLELGAAELPTTPSQPQLPPVSVVNTPISPNWQTTQTTTAAPQIMPQTIATSAAVPTASVTASKTTIDSFGLWVGQQPEFSGMGMINNFIPFMKEMVGTVEYHKLSEQQLTEVRAKLEAKLAELRK